MTEPIPNASLIVAMLYADVSACESLLEPVEIERIDFDGSVVGTVTLVDGREIDVLVDVDPSPRGQTTFDALNDSDVHRVWIAEHEDELHTAWKAALAARGER